MSHSSGPRARFLQPRTTSRWRLASALAATGVALSSLAPLAVGANGLAGADKLVHVALYVLLAACAARAWPRVSWTLRASVLANNGGMPEPAQAWTPARTPSWADAVANCGGISIMLDFDARRFARRARPAKRARMHEPSP